MFFGSLTLLLIVFFIFTIKYVIQIDDVKGKVFLGILLLSGCYYVFVSVITILVLEV